MKKIKELSKEETDNGNIIRMKEIKNKWQIIQAEFRWECIKGNEKLTDKKI